MCGIGLGCVALPERAPARGPGEAGGQVVESQRGEEGGNCVKRGHGDVEEGSSQHRGLGGSGLAELSLQTEERCACRCCACTSWSLSPSPSPSSHSH